MQQYRDNNLNVTLIPSQYRSLSVVRYIGCFFYWCPNHGSFISGTSRDSCIARGLKITPCRFAVGHAVALLFEALRYKPEGLGFDSR